jgi:hypothetical protein
MGGAFRPAVSTGARETLNLVVDRQIRCLAEDRATSRTEWPAEKTTNKFAASVNRATIEVPDHRHGH